MAPQSVARRTLFCKSAQTLCVVVFLFSVAATCAFPQCKSVDVPFVFENGKMVLQAKINGNPVRMVLDTGAQITAVNIKGMKVVGKIKQTSADGHSSVVDVAQVYFQIGCISGDLQVLKMPKPADGLDGYLGENVLKSFKKITIDLEKSSVRLEK